ncbi:hypothetical protein CDES_08650 [Corynebacterium deserti GIMN1.010]|uniref:Lactose phosphotransferase system repressor n=1 Tax=Corynebacterium deserti GIMN1.010 TaxID=931089 RepID=A0A0M4CMA5_9CORY|nr:DeoR/GlpR family DNA-binding transcription regulator [Corynebacterium deserti]ALC06122.1 hypothetical protein CDES_08650 [Corynebacterium deserti GIMN1.010]
MVTQPDRQHRILSLLEPTGAVSVGDLAEHFEVTTETIRRDLRIMESHGLLQRVHGGAITPEPMGASPPAHPRVRVPGFPPTLPMLELAEVAVTTIEPGARSIFLDAGAGCTAIATVLSDPPEDARWTVVTNSPGAVIALSQSGDTATVVLCGRVHQKSQSVVGANAVKMISSLRADIAFVEVDALDSDARFYTFHPETIPIKKAMMNNARCSVAVLRHDAQHNTGMHSFASVTDFDVLVTNAQPSDTRFFSDHNIQVVTP